MSENHQTKGTPELDNNGILTSRLRYEKPSMITEILPPQLSVGQCSLDPDIYACSLTTNYADNSAWETGFPGFCHF
ncbi:MAG: hypothetical protein QGH40_15725 [bacterium]|nr:hypothetical protein [bacterium]